MYETKDTKWLIKEEWTFFFSVIVAWQRHLSLHIWEDPGDGTAVADAQTDQPDQEWTWERGMKVCLCQSFVVLKKTLKDAHINFTWLDGSTWHGLARFDLIWLNMTHEPLWAKAYLRLNRSSGTPYLPSLSVDYRHWFAFVHSSMMVFWQMWEIKYIDLSVPLLPPPNSLLNCKIALPPRSIKLISAMKLSSLLLYKISESLRWYIANKCLVKTYWLALVFINTEQKMSLSKKKKYLNSCTLPCHSSFCVITDPEHHWFIPWVYPPQEPSRCDHPAECDWGSASSQQGGEAWGGGGISSSSRGQLTSVRSVKF